MRSLWKHALTTFVAVLILAVATTARDATPARAHTVGPITLTTLSTTFNGIVGIDHYEPTNQVAVSVNYPTGVPHNFELVAADGTHSQFSSQSGFTDEVKIATVRSGPSQGCFTPGDLFVGTGIAGQIARVSNAGATITNPWATLTGETGLMRGSLFQDRYGAFGGNLIAVTTSGGVWVIPCTGGTVATPLANLRTHLEGVTTVPNNVAQYGPWAGKILAGAEGSGTIFAIDSAGAALPYQLGINPEDFDIIPANENFYGVNYGGNALMGAPASEFAGMTGDLLVTQESPGLLFDVHWDAGAGAFHVSQIASVTQWEHVTFSSAGIAEIPPTCPTCDGTTITVDEDVSVDLNPAIPTCNDGVTNDLCDYFSFDKTGTDASQWKAIFTVGASKLIIKDNATVTTVPVPYNGNNRKAPGIEIVGNCELFIEGDLDNNGEPGGIVVTSINQQAGDIKIVIDGNITIDGHVRNQVLGTNGTPGDITIASCCGDITTGPKSRIETIGVDVGGGDINILTCCHNDSGTVDGGGDIVINGLVRAIHKQGATPTINVVAFHGAVTIDGRNNFGEEVEAGTTVRRMSGLLVKTTGATVAGDINIQAQNNVTVYGNTIINKNRVQYGAVAIKSNNTNGQGGDGDMTVISTNGGIRAIDRAFDFDNRFDALNAITLLTLNDINLAVGASINNGAADNTKAVVSSQGGLAGKGGTNTLRSYCGAINIGVNAQVLANAPGGSPGTNLLTSSAGVNNLGTVNPADANIADDNGPCNEFGPPPIFRSCEEFDVFCRQFDSIIDADGFASPLSGDPGAREVVNGDPLVAFGTVTGTRCGIDWFDQDVSGDWSNGDDLHCESTQCQPFDPTGAAHDIPEDCVVLDINNSFVDLELVDCDLDFMIAFTACPSAILKYHDANSNGQYDNGEDIVLDANLNGIFD